MPVEQWSQNADYKRAKVIVDALRVANDAAESGVKLSQDFRVAAKKEKRYQQILQVVENSRNTKPNQRKRKAVSKSWYLTL